MCLTLTSSLSAGLLCWDKKKRHQQKIAVLAHYFQFSNWKAVSVCELELHQQCHCYILPADISTGQILTNLGFPFLTEATASAMTLSAFTNCGKSPFENCCGNLSPASKMSLMWPALAGITRLCSTYLPAGYSRWPIYDDINFQTFCWHCWICLELLISVPHK